MRCMFRLELNKALKNKFFYVAIIIGSFITVLSLIYNINIYQKNFSVDTENVNPMYGAFSLFNLWIGGEPFSFGSAAYFCVFPLLVSIPYGWSYCEEKRSGYIRMVIVRSGKKAYLLSKYIAVFVSGALAMVIPLLFNFCISALFFPATTPTPVYCTSNGIFYESLMSMIYYSSPFLYVLFYLCIDFVFGGLISCISYATACFVKHRTVAVIVPLFCLLSFHYLRQFIYISPEVRYKEISPLFFLRPVQLVYNVSWEIILGEAIVLFLITFFFSVIWERKNEVY